MTCCLQATSGSREYRHAAKAFVMLLNDCDVVGEWSRLFQRDSRHVVCFPPHRGPPTPPHVSGSVAGSARSQVPFQHHCLNRKPLSLIRTSSSYTLDSVTLRLFQGGVIPTKLGVLSSKAPQRTIVAHRMKPMRRPSCCVFFFFFFCD
jgi:hypothetical protein